VNDLTPEDLRTIRRTVVRFPGMVREPDIDDVVQEAALSVWRVKDLPTGIARDGYLIVITKRRVVDYFRRRGGTYHPDVFYNDDVEIVARCIPAPARGDASEARMDLVSELKKLNVAQLYTTMLFACGWSHREIAALAPGLVVSEHSSAQLVHRARGSLERSLPPILHSGAIVGAA
jgi:DNA-directed RNA polymerase specialized sigma24 family protein